MWRIRCIQWLDFQSDLSQFLILFAVSFFFLLFIEFLGARKRDAEIIINTKIETHSEFSLSEVQKCECFCCSPDVAWVYVYLKKKQAII